MKLTMVLILCVLMTGCSSVILREDDHAGHTIAKVTARTLLALPTVGISEAFVGKAKRREALAAKLADQDAYIGVSCTKEGLEPGTPAFRGCVSVKRDQMEQRMRAQ